MGNIVTWGEKFKDEGIFFTRLFLDMTLHSRKHHLPTSRHSQVRSGIHRSHRAHKRSRQPLLPFL